MEYAFHIELNISVLGEQAQRLKLLSKVILHISGEMPSLYFIKKNPLNATMRNSYIPMGNWDTETVISSMILASRVRMKNTTTTSRQPGLIKHWLSQSKEYGLEGWLCATAKAVAALESKEWEKTSGTAWRLFSQHRMERRPFSHQSSALEMGKPHQKLGVHCVSQSCSFTQQLQRLPGTSSLWRALTGELKSPLSAHGSLRGIAVLANSASLALRFLAALAPLAAEFQSPVERVAHIPQKPGYWLDEAPVLLRF